MEPDVTGKLSVLFVDDEENILKSLRRLFAVEDFGVLTAGSGRDALGILRERGDIALIVSDQRMPEMTGVDFLEKAREVRPDSIRILLTGYADLEAVVAAINRGGAYRYVSKPWNDDDLLRTIKDALQIYGLRRENEKLNDTIREKNRELEKWNTRLEDLVKLQTADIQQKNERLEAFNKDLKNNFKGTIIAFSGLIELRSRMERGHSKKVAELATRVARDMGLPGEEVETIAVAALLHDIGKIGLPDNILHMDFDKMTPAEFEEFKQHSVRGQSAIDGIGSLRNSGTLIRSHHENFNGSGFPDALVGAAIPLGARIIAVADYVDRKLMNLRGKDALAYVLEKLKEGQGGRFDPKLVPIFARAVPDVYKDLLQVYAAEDMVEKKLSLDKLEPGMRIARDFKSGTGVLLLSNGTELDKESIEAIMRNHLIDPSMTGIYIWMKRQAA